MNEEIENMTGAGAAGAETGKVEATPIPGVETVQNEGPKEPVPSNPFDFTEVEDSAGGESGGESDDAGAGEESGEYTLDFGSAFGGTDEVRNMITDHARAAGISAEAGSKFVAAVCQSLLAQQQERGAAAYEALEQEWGADFEKNIKGTKLALHQMMKAGVIREEDKAELMTPAVFRMVNHLRLSMGERPAVGTNKAAQMDGRKEYERIMNDPKSKEFQILMNPQHPDYKQTASYMNSLAGIKLH